MKERLAFSTGTGVVLLGTSLVVNGVAQVQTGPGWEIPAAAATNWILFGLIYIILYGLGIICYFRGNRFASLSPPSRKTFWILLGVGLLITVLSYVLDPGQWQFTHRNLSAVAEKSSIPVSAICGIIWILLTVRTRWDPSMDL
jgi:hypothetical protein